MTQDQQQRQAITAAYGKDEADRLLGQEGALDRLYNHKPPPPSGELYPFENAIGGDLDRNLLKLAARYQLSDEERAAEVREFCATMRTTGLHDDPGLVVLLHTAYTDARLADGRPGGDEGDRKVAISNTTEETWSRLRGTFGADFDPLLARTLKWAKQHQQLDAILSTGDVGARFDVTEALMQHVRRHGLGPL